MTVQQKPYLIIPKLIEQPTWGGDYILESKKWKHKTFLSNKKIGQSYELYGPSKLLLNLNDSSSAHFVPEIGYADKTDTLQEHFSYKESDFVVLEKLVQHFPEKVLGKYINESFHKMPLLIKFTQAAGNSFQLHVRPGTQDAKWQPKPESWYYFENGLITLGLKKGQDITKYREVCEKINNLMLELSRNIQDKIITLEEAKKQAGSFIAKENPWQFVNTYEVPANCLIDLSQGAVHHSWEENKEKFPLGNVLYEVQLDVMDPVSTIRSFDQGKFKSDGSIRPLTIDEYFKYVDTNPEHNDISYMKKVQNGSKLLRTPYYSLDIFSITDEFNDTTNASFVHLFVRNGAVRVKAKDGEVRLGSGHSCFIPNFTETYTIIPEEKNSIVLKTYID